MVTVKLQNMTASLLHGRRVKYARGQLFFTAIYSGLMPLQLTIMTTLMCRGETLLDQGANLRNI